MLSKEAFLMGLGISSAIYYVSLNLTLDVLFPFVSLYHILTFSLSYPWASDMLKFLVTFALVFSDTLLTSFVFQNAFPTRLWMWVVEFTIIYQLIASVTQENIKTVLAGKSLRSFIYVAVGYFKATTLTALVLALSRDYNPQSALNFAVLMGAGLSKLLIPVAVYLFYYFLCSERQFDGKVLDSAVKRGKVSFLAVSLVIECCVIWPAKDSDCTVLFNGELRKADWLPLCYMIVWYLHEAEVYGEVFRIKNR
jgi:hypothetical protein